VSAKPRQSEKLRELDELLAEIDEATAGLKVLRMQIARERAMLLGERWSLLRLVAS
jgi:hypothetical protein